MPKNPEVNIDGLHDRITELEGQLGAANEHCADLWKMLKEERAAFVRRMRRDGQCQDLACMNRPHAATTPCFHRLAQDG